MRGRKDRIKIIRSIEESILYFRNKDYWQIRTFSCYRRGSYAHYEYGEDVARIWGVISEELAAFHSLVKLAEATRPASRRVKDWITDTSEAIAEADVFLALITEPTPEGRWMEDELLQALQLDPPYRPLIVLLFAEGTNRMALPDEVVSALPANFPTYEVHLGAEESFGFLSPQAGRDIARRIVEHLARDRPPSPRIIDPSRHPLESGIPPSWASGWGQDEHGVFVEITVDDVTQAIRWCPPGRFLMGSPDAEQGRRNDEGPQTEITFTKGFWLFETPVTQALYRAVTGASPSEFEGDLLPVETVSWDDAQTFMRLLNDRLPGIDLGLPSEAQWEYACRAGSTTPFEPNVARAHAGADILSEEVNFVGDYPLGPAPKSERRGRTVECHGGGFRSNAWGLRHMHGNVWEWCEDVWHESHEGASRDGSPRTASKLASAGWFFVLRGGAWTHEARNCRAVARDRRAAELRNSDIGFRPAPGQGRA